MHTSIQSTLVLLLMTTTTSILANPIQVNPSSLASDMYGRSIHQVMNIANDAAKPPACSTTKSAGAKSTGTPTPCSPQVQALASGMTANNAGAKSTGTATPCSPQVQALASGISANIADQRNEQAAVTTVGNILDESPLDTTKFNAAKSSLLNFVNKGILIRENNQKIAPAGNAAIAGLAIVATAQQEEFNLTMSLTASDVSGSKATVAKLKTDFAGGITQNEKNLAAATQGCKMPSTSASPKL